MKNEPMQSLPVGVSVVIVCRNALNDLQTTLHSLAALPNPKPLVYIVDGASNDGTPAYLANCPVPLARWVSEQDSGIYDAMNKGWDMAADNSFILYLGAGDKLLSLPDMESVANDHRSGIDIIIGDCDMGSYVFHSMWYDDILLSNKAHHQAMMLHKSVSPKSPFEPTFKVYGDWDFNARLY